MALVDHLDEVADDQGDGLDALQLLLGADFLALELLLVLLDEVLLDFEELEVAVELLKLLVLVLEVGVGSRGQVW